VTILARVTPRALVFVVLVATTRLAVADGERTPLFGVAVIAGEGARTPAERDAQAGFGLDVAWWHGRFGLAAESSLRWSVTADAARTVVVGASARVRVLDRLAPSLFDPRDVEVGVELQAIVERVWRSIDAPIDPYGYGLGLAVRVRGSGDPDSASLFAESRFSLRVMASRWDELDAIARTSMPTSMPDRALTVLLCIGAAWGRGDAAYMQRFRLHPLLPD